MNDDAARPADSSGAGAAPGVPVAVGRGTFQAEVDRLAGRQPNRMYIMSYRRAGGRVFETYWATIRGVEAMDNSYALMDLTVYGRQEAWEDSPAGWPQQCTNTRTSSGPPDWSPVAEWPDGRPISQWTRVNAGRPDDLGTGR